MYTTPTLIQSTWSSSDVTTWHPDQVHLPIFNTLHFTFSVGGEEVPCNLIQVVSDTFGGTLAFRERLQPSKNLRSWIVENPTRQVFQTHFPIPFHVFPTTLSLWGINSPRGRDTKSHTC